MKHERDPYRKCSVTGCDRKHFGKGYCALHYHRMRNGNDLNAELNRKSGTGHITKSGYIRIERSGKAKFEHVLVAERVLGKPLPRGVVVHHIDGNKSNNSYGNLVICPSEEYHSLLHKRQRALVACGKADYRPCSFCKEYDDISNLKANIDCENGRIRSHFHNECRKSYDKARGWK